MKNLKEQNLKKSKIENKTLKILFIKEVRILLRLYFQF